MHLKVLFQQRSLGFILNMHSGSKYPSTRLSAIFSRWDDAVFFFCYFLFIPLIIIFLVINLSVERTKIERLMQ